MATAYITPTKHGQVSALQARHAGPDAEMLCTDMAAIRAAVHITGPHNAYDNFSATAAATPHLHEFAGGSGAEDALVDERVGAPSGHKGQQESTGPAHRQTTPGRSSTLGCAPTMSHITARQQGCEEALLTRADR